MAKAPEKLYVVTAKMYVLARNKPGAQMFVETALPELTKIPQITHPVVCGVDVVASIDRATGLIQRAPDIRRIVKFASEAT